MTRIKTTDEKYEDAINDKGFRVYDRFRNRKDLRLNQGFDYEGQIFRRTTSPILYAEGTRNKRILDQMDKVFFQLIESVKYIKTFYNYTVHKNDKNFR